MFGYKLITEREYNKLQGFRKEAEKCIENAQKALCAIENDCSSLRLQNSMLRIELQKSRDSLLDIKKKLDRISTNNQNNKSV